VQITNYDSSYTWAGTATASGTVAIDSTGFVTVTGVAANTSSTATITTTRTGYDSGSDTTSAVTSLAAALTPTFGSTTATADGFTVVITNFDSSYTWAGTATASGTVVVTGSGSTGLATITGVAANTSSTATITTTQTGYAGGTADVTETSLLAALTPAFGTPTATADGFTVQISNYDSSYTWAGTATASGSVAIDSTGLVTVTGVAANTSSTATITTTQTGYAGGTAPVTANSLMLMSMVTVGNVGNAADTNTGSVYGAVSYSYQIGAYDVTGSQYTAFLNAVGSTDTYGLYNTFMGTDTQVAQISRSGSSGTYTYAVMNSTGNRPITYVSWFDCARFSNWMSNGQGAGSTETGAYTLLNGQTTGNAVAANPGAAFYIPTENEWYKAAYYSPNYGGTGVGGYYAFATQSSTDPGTTIGSNPNQANYNNAIGRATDVGSFSGSGSFYGTFDQSGNVWQWNDLDGTTGSSRGLRGGDWYINSSYVSSSYRYNGVPSGEFDNIGFRLASPV
jgi:formylglycine-generating enzyme required for sulfatase activity